MRALLYLRNSSDQQAKAATIRAQRPECVALAARLGGDICEYPEEGVSGAASLDERPRMRALLRDARAGDVVIAFALDRLSRSDDLIDQAAIYGALQRAGARVETVLDGAVELSSMVGRIMLTVKSEVAAEERRKIARRTAAGKREAAKEGRKPQGATPYGLRYDRDAGTWSIDAPAAEVVRGIFAALVDGRTCGQIAASLNAAGVNVPKRAQQAASPRWQARRVWHLATRTTYRGEWTFNGCAIAVPAIVDAHTWQAVQAQLLAAGRRGLRRTQHVYLLDEGTGRCDYCGGPLRIRWGGPASATSYYACAVRACGLRWWRTEEADGEAWRRMRAALHRPDLLERAVGSEADAAAGEGEAAGYERRSQRLGEIERAILSRFRRGLISEAGMEGEVATIARERALLEQSATAARVEAKRARAGAEAVRGLREALRAIAAQLDAADPVLRREVVRALRPEIRVSRESMAIRFRVRAPAATGKPLIALIPSTCSSTESHCDLEIVVAA